MNAPLLSISGLTVNFALPAGSAVALNRINLSVQAGERVGLVGESGAGKSVLGFSIVNLISPPGTISSGRIQFDGIDFRALSRSQIRKFRGNQIAMIFQDPMVSLNPVLTIGQQMVEVLKAHRSISYKDARSHAINQLNRVHIPAAESRFNCYPFELSGGMRQRVCVAIALLLEPKLIIADEPTTALDVTIQAEIMALLFEICNSSNAALILITHDLGIVAQNTERLYVLYAGHVVESGRTDVILSSPRHPYTRGLLDALPEQAKPGQPLAQIPGSMPTLGNFPAACPFSPRCTRRQPVCTREMPLQTDPSGTSQVACHFPIDPAE